MPLARPQTSQAIFIWLLVIAAMVSAMILVGGATRLTDSGLSITEWRPVTGAIPPLSEAGWDRELELYRSTHEYQVQNRGMSMSEFQFIYWWEWGHRFLGRMIGLVFAVPFAIFWLRGMIPERLKLPLIALFVLGGLQGAIGWWMVSSGLVDRLDVSQYRLATHLGMAFVILGLSVWLALEARYGVSSRMVDRKAPFGVVFWALVFIQIILGAFVAGLDAGRIYTSWPLMEGRLIPDGYLGGMGWFQAIFESRPAVQLHHRWLGYIVAISAGVLAFRLWRDGHPDLQRAAVWIAAITIIQIVLGITTLVHAAPLSLSLMHQAGAIALFTTAGVTAWKLRRV
ncbi:COX15/CtaA family protein [Hyphobacterium sp. HN65]|uniref:Heme A synthase n=1 Tax=Hyphobacterium lacteum TaxID=3116575 RepID=A0ABU7LM54_9PROT|nr:COX15/CtaA family protein [Hyphobacterium sp. HN65]MEE2525006.1 COX15/CtaA family protein [Hyphobacterium sp. HN65]